MATARLLRTAGAEYDLLTKIATDLQIWIGSNQYELDPAFPQLYFQVSTLVAPGEGVVLRYRRLVSIYTPTRTMSWTLFWTTMGPRRSSPSPTRP